MTRLRNVCAVALTGICFTAEAQVTNTAISVADSFVCTGSPNYQNGADLTGLNFGAAGALAVAPASSAKGEFQSLLKFNLSNGVALFNSAYGSNNWTITSVSLTLVGDYATAGEQPTDAIFNVISGGQFVIEWLSDDNWVEGSGAPRLPTTNGITYSSLPGLLAATREILCTNTYSPPGNGVPVIWTLPLTTSLATDLARGGDVTFRFYAADSAVGYLFDSRNNVRGNGPRIQVVTAPALRILSGAFTNGIFHLTGVGSKGAVCQVQANSDLTTTNWQTIGTATADANGPIQFDDLGAASRPHRCYRLRQ